MTIEVPLGEFAETPGRFTTIPPESSVERFADDRVCVVYGPTSAMVSGVNVAEDELDELIADVRKLTPPENDPTWWMGPSTRPSDLYDQLTRRGFVEPRDRVPTALALATEPEAPSDVDVSRIETFEQYVAARELSFEAFEIPEDRRHRERERYEVEFSEAVRDQVPVGFLATLDGRPAGVGVAIPSERGIFLVGGSTAPWARGHGLYRALVRARWDFAVELSTPALVTHAVLTTSYPILSRLGFEDVCTLRRLQDPVDATS